jgi:hypothetical protein
LTRVQGADLDGGLGRLFSRVRYRGWTWSVDGDRRLSIFRPDPADPRRLQRLGPWTLPDPDDMGTDEARVFALAVATEVDGESARESFQFLGRPA